MKNVTALLGHTSPRAVGVATMTAQDAAEFTLDNLDELAVLGLGVSAQDVRQMHAALDAAPDLVNGGPASGIVVEFLRNWLPGVIATVTQARKIDELVGITTAGSWSDEEVIQETMELSGLAVPYGDLTNVPLASYDSAYAKRGVVRFELGAFVGKLESDRAGRQRINAMARKRSAVGLALNIQRNRVGFYGYNSGANAVYGFLNDPNLPAYASVAATGTGSTTTWATKSFLAITGDIREAMSALQVQSGDNLDPRTAKITLAVPTTQVGYLTVTNEFGQSVEAWLKATYPNTRVVSAPELTAANGGANVFYLYAETFQDDAGSDDNGRVFDQIVPATLQLLGVEPRVKGVLEDYTNATAGVMVKRPFLVVRRTGI